MENRRFTQSTTFVAIAQDRAYLGRMTPLAYVFSLPVRAYRLIFSPWVGFNCRYQPTCSAYAMEALEKHGAIKGAWLAARRIGRCHPLGSSGYDPVPGSDPEHDSARADKTCSCSRD